MKLIWSRNLYIQNPWEPKFRGVFSHCKSDISFYYMDGSTVMMVCGCVGNPIALTGKTNGLKIPLPRYWAIVEAKKERYLMCGDGIAINLEKNVPIAPVKTCAIYIRSIWYLLNTLWKILLCLENIKLVTSKNGDILVKKMV